MKEEQSVKNSRCNLVHESWFLKRARINGPRLFSFWLSICLLGYVDLSAFFTNIQNSLKAMMICEPLFWASIAVKSHSEWRGMLILKQPLCWNDGNQVSSAKLCQKPYWKKLCGQWLAAQQLEWFEQSTYCLLWIAVQLWPMFEKITYPVVNLQLQFIFSWLKMTS